MENLKINVPEGYEIDREKSTFEEIVFRKKVAKKWVDDENAIVKGFFINNNSTIRGGVGFNRPLYYNLFPNSKQAESARAYSRLAQIIEYDKRFGGRITDEEWDTFKVKYVIFRNYNSISTDWVTNFYQFLAFHTKWQRDLFLEENEDLIKSYFMLD